MTDRGYFLCNLTESSYTNILGRFTLLCMRYILWELGACMSDRSFVLFSQWQSLCRWQESAFFRSLGKKKLWWRISAQKYSLQVKNRPKSKKLETQSGWCDILSFPKINFWKWMRVFLGNRFLLSEEGKARSLFWKKNKFTDIDISYL